LENIFGIAVNEIWKKRDELVFSNHINIVNDTISNIRHQTIFIAQCSPQNDNLLNEFGGYESFTASSRSIACGGLVRDSHTHPIQGFYNKLGPCNSTC
jgi:hypothetical protein